VSIVRRVCPIPQTYRDLLEGCTYAVLSTVIQAAQDHAGCDSQVNTL
jgi:hypothetical protein